jgi:hypothetical protein
MKLSGKKIILFLIVIVLVIAAIWFFVFLNGQQKENIIDGTKNLFPFGEISSNGDTPNNGSQQTDSEDSQGGVQNSGDGDTFESEGPRLRQVSDFPTGGFVPITRTEEEEIIEVVMSDDGISIETFRDIEVENQYVRYSSIKDATVYESQLTPAEIEQDELVNNFIPNAERAFFNKTGERVLFQYWNTKDHTSESYLARVEPIELTINPCPFTFASISLGDEGEQVMQLHQFLNRNQQTRIARSGINAPGNESSFASELTITAIKNFQSLYQIDIDGNIGSGTQAKMTEVCDDQERKVAEAEFDQREERYTISGFFLPQDILNVNMSPDGNQMFYLQKDRLGIIGILRDFVDDSRISIFESPFGEWTSQWKNDSKIELSTKPSHLADGYSYELDADTQRYFKSLAQKPGLVTNVSPDNSRVLFMETNDTTIQLSLFERDTKRTRPLSIQTFPEKCTWLANSIDLYCGVPGNLSYGNQYPDVWYQGIETHVDALWKIDAVTLEETLVSDMPREYQENIDIETINVDEKGEYLYFIDKSEEFLWSYRLIDF